MIDLAKFVAVVEATPGDAVGIHKDQILELIALASRGQHAMAAMANLHTMTALASQALGVRA
jgi:hypothetical protein